MKHHIVFACLVSAAAAAVTAQTRVPIENVKALLDKAMGRVAP